MRSLSLLALALIASSATQAQGLPQLPEEEVLVIVWAGKGDRCSVLERSTNCSRVASVMSSTLQVGRNRSIVVATNGKDPEIMIRLAQVMTDIRAAGFRNVRQADPPR